MLPKREIAKFAATTTVAASVDYGASAALESTTDIDTDTIQCSVATAVFGYVVAVKLSPVTDKLVDRVADRLAARKARKNITNENA